MPAPRALDDDARLREASRSRSTSELERESLARGLLERLLFGRTAAPREPPNDGFVGRIIGFDSDFGRGLLGQRLTPREPPEFGLTGRIIGLDSGFFGRMPDEDSREPLGRWIPEPLREPLGR